jgi:hypothetical protein
VKSRFANLYYITASPLSCCSRTENAEPLSPHTLPQTILLFQALYQLLGRSTNGIKCFECTAIHECRIAWRRAITQYGCIVALVLRACVVRVFLRRPPLNQCLPYCLMPSQYSRSACASSKTRYPSVCVCVGVCM